VAEEHLGRLEEAAREAGRVAVLPRDLGEPVVAQLEDPCARQREQDRRVVATMSCAPARAARAMTATNASALVTDSAASGSSST
jgi:hypothetical protein